MRLPSVLLNALVPLLTTALGFWVATASGIPYSAFLPNVLAILIGAVLLYYPPPIARFPEASALIALTVLTLTFLFPGMESVHRWISLGPLKLNASMALLPIVLFSLLHLRTVPLLTATVLTCLIHLGQPDAGQATVFALAASVIFVSRKSLGVFVRVAGVLCVVIFAALTWGRPDPLAPVEQVEEILRLAFSHGLDEAAAGISAVLIIFLPMARAVLNRSGNDQKQLAISFGALMLGSFAVTEFGNFPVPLIGAGAGPILGWFCIVILLNADSRT